MSRSMVVAVLCAVVAVASGCLIGGCGDATNPLPVGRVEVPMLATVSVEPFAIRQIALTATWPGDHFDAAGATARIQRPDGTSDAVSLDVSPDGNKITLGQATAVPSGAADHASQGTVSADVRLIATIDQVPGEITGVVLRTRDLGDTLDITGARAWLYPENAQRSPIDLAISPDQTEVRLGPVSIATPGDWSWAYLRIEGPFAVRDGATGSATWIRSLEFWFDMRPDGHIVVPDTIRVSIPTLGTADDRRIVMEGLAPAHDHAWVELYNGEGGAIRSREYEADPAGQIIITDTMARVTADWLAARYTSISMIFSDPAMPGNEGSPPPGPGSGGTDGESTRNLNVVVIDGPLWAVNGGTGARVEIGRVKFGFEVLKDGTVVAPSGFTFGLPASGRARNRGLAAAGLHPGDFGQTRTAADNGPVIRSPVCRADSSGNLLIPRFMGPLTALQLSGPHSSLAFCFARTDANDDGFPDMF